LKSDGIEVFVKWFLVYKIFEQGNHFMTVMEQVQGMQRWYYCLGNREMEIFREWV